jgi:hypothetical protein
MDVAGFSETLLLFYQVTRRHIPEDSNLRVHWRENLKARKPHTNKDVRTNREQADSESWSGREERKSFYYNVKSERGFYI